MPWILKLWNVQTEVTSVISKCFPGRGEGGDAHRVQAFLELRHDILKGDSGSPSRSCGFVNLLTFSCAHAPINSEKKKCFEFVSCHLWQSKVCVRTFFVIIKCMLPLAKSYPDGMSLTGRNAARGLCWCCHLESALGEPALRGESVHGAECKPCSSFQIQHSQPGHHGHP